MKQKLLFTSLMAFLMLISVRGWGQENITPIRTAVSGFGDWTDTDVVGTTYLQLLKATSVTISPAMNFDNFSDEKLNFKARTYGGTNTSENEVFISISTNNGVDWTDLGSRTPSTNSLTSMPEFDLSSYSGTQVKVRFYVKGTSNSIGVGIDDISITGTAGSVEPEPTNQPTDFTATANSSSTITTSWTDAAAGTQSPSGYLILANTTGTFTDPVDGTPQADDTSLGDGAGAMNITHGSGASHQWTSLNAATLYYFKIYPYTNSGANIDYKIDGTVQTADASTLDADSEVYAGTQLIAKTISSLVDTKVEGENENVFVISIEDVGGDGQPTKVTNIRVKPHSTNTADWSDAIQGVFVDNETDYIYPTATITDTYIDLAFGSGDLNVADGTALEVTLYIYLNTSAIVDNSILSFMVDADDHGFTADPSGSGFVNAFLLGDFNSNDITIGVEATQLSFIQQPTNVNVNVAMSPAITVAFTDINGNIDIDYNGTGYGISLTTSGTFAGGATTAVDATNGISTFDNILYSAAGTGITITASDEGWGNTAAESSIFDITSIPKIFFSEYIEGSSNNKAIEIYNGENSSIDLSKLTINTYPNGAVTPTYTQVGTGTLLPGKVFVIANSSSASGILAIADLISTVTYYNGNDAVELVYDGITTDIIGIIGNDPGTGWEVGGTSSATAEHTLLRKLSVNAGETDWVTSAGTDASNSQWVVMQQDYFSNLGFYGTVFTEASTDWNTSSNWDLGTPNQGVSAKILSGVNAEISSTSEANCKNLIVAGTLTIKSDATGTGSLIVNGTSTGSINFERYLSGYSNDDNGWHFLAIPLNSLTIVGSNFEPTQNVDDLYRFDEAEDVNNWLNYNAGTFNETDLQVGKGYLVAYQNSDTKTYTGSTIRTTDLTVDLAYTDGKPNAGWNLIGNPYTSAIDWDLVTRTASVNGSVYVINSANGLFKSWNGSTGDLIDGIIPANQGFFVLATATDQSVTLGAGSSGDQAHSPTTYYKNAVNLADNTFKVSLSSAKGADNTYIQLRDDATESFDKQIDAYKVFGFGELSEIYSSDDNNKYSINCLPSDLRSKQIKIGVKSVVASQNQLSFEGLTQLLDQYQIILEDLMTDQNMQVNEGFVYAFASEPSDAPDRFLLHFGAVGIGEQDQPATLNAYVFDNRLYVNNSLEKAQLAIYDIQGRLVVQQAINAAGLQSLPLNLPVGIYVLQLSNAQEAQSVKINVQ